MVEKTTKKSKTKSKAKTKTQKTNKTDQPSQQVPPREGINPITIPKGAPQQVSIPADNPIATPPPPEEPVKPLFNDIQELQYYYDYLKYCSEKAGFGMEGVTFHHHDLASYIKVAIIAIQRTQVANQKHMELESIKRQLKTNTPPNE